MSAPERTNLEWAVETLAAILFVVGVIVLFIGLIGTIGHHHGHPNWMGAAIVSWAALGCWLASILLLALVSGNRS